MASYVVMQPPPPAGAIDGAVTVRDGFSVIGFLVPPLWLLWHKLWIEALLALAVGVALTMLGEVAGLGLVGAGLSLLVSIYVGLEGAALRLSALRRRGWRDWGAVDASSRAEAEIRFLSAQGDVVAPDEAPRAMTPVPLVARPVASGPALGLFNYPGRR